MNQTTAAALRGTLSNLDEALSRVDSNIEFHTSHLERAKADRVEALTAHLAGRAVGPVGFRKDGRPIFPIAGGAPDDPPADDPPKDDPPKFEPITSQEDLDKRLGERLARERAKFEGFDEYRKKAEEFDKAAEAARTDQEKAVEAAKNEGRTEALTAANTRLVAAEARALAAEAKFRNPALAVRAVDLADVTVNDSGEVDGAAIKAKLKELSDAEPYLVDDGKKPAPRSDPSQGGGKSEGKAALAGLSGSELYDRLHPKRATTTS